MFNWYENQPRGREAGVPEDVEFATKSQLAVKMLWRALESGIQPVFVLADTVYGNDGKFRGSSLFRVGDLRRRLPLGSAFFALGPPDRQAE